jgi:two-component system OmpR family sensor kinase
MLGRLPIRVRMAAAFAILMAVVLAATAVFVYVRQRDDLDESVNNGLRSRSDNVAALVQQSAGDGGLSQRGGSRLAESEENFAQLLTPAGAWVDGTNPSRQPALSPGQARHASRFPVFYEHRLPYIDGPARILARPVAVDGRRLVVVTGTQIEDRNDALAGLGRSFLIGGLVAVLIASGIAYLLARASLRPIEAMRQRAKRISLSRGGERLPLPKAHDEVHRLGETLNEMLARLAASLERERQFVADAGHELRTPIAVVKTELESALRTTGRDPEVRLAVEAALEEVDNLVQLAEDLLLIARAGEGHLALRREDTRVRDLLEQARRRFADRAHRQGRQIEVEAPDGLRMSLDQMRTGQALANLVSNALRYGAGDVRISAREASDGLEIEVADEGPGFPPDLVPHAFERFAVGEGGRSDSGAGLGLAIVRAIAEAHGGTATIVDRSGSGAIVRLAIPGSPTSNGVLSASSQAKDAV